MSQIANDPGPWMDLLGAVLHMIQEDAAAMRRRGLLDEHGHVTDRARATYRDHNRHVAPLKGRGVQRIDEVAEVGRMIYRGGIDCVLAGLGLEPFGWQIRDRVERSVADKTRRDVR